MSTSTVLGPIYAGLFQAMIISFYDLMCFWQLLFMIIRIQKHNLLRLGPLILDQSETQNYCYLIIDISSLSRRLMIPNMKCANNFYSHAAIRIHLSKMMKNPQKGANVKGGFIPYILEGWQEYFPFQEKRGKKKRLLQVIYLFNIT